MFTKTRLYILLCFSALFLFHSVCIAGSEIGFVTVKTKSDLNKNVNIYYRVPANYTPLSTGLYRVLVIFGGRNCSGINEARGGMGFAKWADENNVFIVAPGFKDDEYWDPKEWSGDALFDGLDAISKEYKICKTRLLYYGYSCGSQCANLFAAWRPAMCLAWVSHACGVWHEANRAMNDVPGLATCGDADIQRYMLTRKFVVDARKKGNYVIWKSFQNTKHEVPKDSITLAKAFMEYYHKASADELIPGGIRKPLSMKSHKKILFVGDDQEGLYWPTGSPELRMIDIDDRVEFYSEDIAIAWGNPGKDRALALKIRKDAYDDEF